jgi:hypothetical protein
LASKFLFKLLSEQEKQVSIMWSVFLLTDAAVYLVSLNVTTVFSGWFIICK